MSGHRRRRRGLLLDAADDFLELVRRQQVFLFERLGLHLLEHGQLFFVGGLDAELLAPFFDRRWTAVLAEDDVDRLLADELRGEGNVLDEY